MDAIKFASAPIPVSVAGIREYSKAVKDATFAAAFSVAKLSKKAKDLLAECCAAEQLPAPVPAFLEIYEAAENASFILLKPTMTESAQTLPVTVTKREVKADLGKLLAAKGLTTVKGTRLVIPVSATSIGDWGAALVLHMAALKWVPIGKRGEAQPEDLDQKKT